MAKNLETLAAEAAAARAAWIANKNQETGDAYLAARDALTKATPQRTFKYRPPSKAGLRQQAERRALRK